MYERNLKLYRQIIDQCPEIKLKGKTMPYTSANGHMFSQLNKAGEIGFRFSEEVKEKYLEELSTAVFKTYGAIMRGYIIIPEKLLEDIDRAAQLLQESYQYAMNLPPK